MEHINKCCINTAISEPNLSRRSFSRRQIESAVLIPCKLLIFLPPFEILLHDVPSWKYDRGHKISLPFYDSSRPSPPHCRNGSTSFIFLHLPSRMSLTEMEFPSRVAQKLIRLTRSLCSVRSDKLLVGWRAGSRKSWTVVSIQGVGGRKACPWWTEQRRTRLF